MRLGNRYYINLLCEIFEIASERTRSPNGEIVFKLSDLGDPDEWRDRGFFRLVCRGAIETKGKMDGVNLYRIPDHVVCKIKQIKENGNGRKKCKI